MEWWRSVAPPTEVEEFDRKQISNGKSCGHPGCLNHVTHPCEFCGRIAGQRQDDPATIKEKRDEETCIFDDVCWLVVCVYG